jgi:hypothetical protein
VRRQSHARYRVGQVCRVIVGLFLLLNRSLLPL